MILCSFVMSPKPSMHYFQQGRGGALVQMTLHTSALYALLQP